MTQPAFEVCMKRLCALPCEGLRANLLIPWGSVTESHVEVFRLVMGGTPSHHPFIDRFSMIFHDKPSSYWGTPILKKPPLCEVTSCTTNRPGKTSMLKRVWRFVEFFA